MGSWQPSNLQLRLATAIIGIPVLAALVYAGGWPFAIAAGLIAAMATIEFIHGFLLPSLPIRGALPHAQVAVVALFGVAGAHEMTGIVIAMAVLGTGLVVLGRLPLALLGPRKPIRIQGWALVYIAVPAALIVLLRDHDDGRSWVVLAILGAFAVDTGAYAVGRAIGRHKLAPAISPKKTIEGAVGGYILGAAAVLGLIVLLDVTLATWARLALALLLPPVAMAGDLLESWLKRRMGIKDASGLLPGHGGFMDRLDSVLPVGALVYAIVRIA